MHHRSLQAPSLSALEDQPAASSLQLDLIPSFDPGTVVFNPDHTISTTLLTRLASATSATIQQLYRPFVRPVLIDNDCGSPLCLSSTLQNSGAQDSNFVARQIYDQLPHSIRNLSRPTNRVVRLGDSRSLPVNLEVPLTLTIPDSLGHIHAHSLYYSVLDVLSHDATIGLLDLIGPYYDLFEDSIVSSWKLGASNYLITHIDDISTAVTINRTTST